MSYYYDERSQGTYCIHCGESMYSHGSECARWEQCPGCPEGGHYLVDGEADGCSRHSTAAHNARSRDPQMGGGNLPLD